MVLKQILLDGATMKNNNFYTSFKNAFNGMVHFFSTERNGQIQLVVSCVVIGFSFFFKIATFEWIIVLLLCALVIGAEMLNTAIEKTCDKITTEYSENIKHIKDMAAGAVLVIAIIAVIAGLILFLPYIKHWLF